MTEEKLQRLQIYEQSLQNLLMQKQQFQGQQAEIDTALKALEQSEESYRIIGNIMVKTDRKGLIDDLALKSSALALRLSTLERQESGIKEKAEALQQEIMKSMKE